MTIQELAPGAGELQPMGQIGKKKGFSFLQKANYKTQKNDGENHHSITIEAKTDTGRDNL